MRMTFMAFVRFRGRRGRTPFRPWLYYWFGTTSHWLRAVCRVVLLLTLPATFQAQEVPPVTSPSHPSSHPSGAIDTSPCTTAVSLQENSIVLYQLLPLVHPSELPALRQQLCLLQSTLLLAQLHCLKTETGRRLLPAPNLPACQFPELDLLFTAHPCVARNLLEKLSVMGQSPPSVPVPSGRDSQSRWHHVQTICLPAWQRKLTHPARSCHSSVPSADSLSGSASHADHDRCSVPALSLPPPEHSCLEWLRQWILGEIRWGNTSSEWIHQQNMIRRHIAHTCFPTLPPLPTGTDPPRGTFFYSTPPPTRPEKRTEK